MTGEVKVVGPTALVSITKAFYLNCLSPFRCVHVSGYPVGCNNIFLWHHLSVQTLFSLLWFPFSQAVMTGCSSTHSRTFSLYLPPKTCKSKLTTWQWILEPSLEFEHRPLESILYPLLNNNTLKGVKMVSTPICLVYYSCLLTHKFPHPWTLLHNVMPCTSTHPSYFAIVIKLCTV